MAINLRNKILPLFKDEIVLDTVVVFLGTTLAGFFSLLYHFVSVRMLSPQDYGTLNALISMVLLTSMAFSPLRTTLTRFFTEHITKKEFSTLTTIFRKLIKRLFIFMILTMLLFFYFSPQLGRFLKTDVLYIFVCGLIIAISLFSPLLTSLLQSFQKFGILTSVIIFSSLGKLITGAFLMYLTLGVLGGLLGFFIGSVLTILIPLFFIAGIFQKEIGEGSGSVPTLHEQSAIKYKKNPPTAQIVQIKIGTSHSISLVPIYKYFFPVSLTILSFTLLTNIDVVLVKHFFSSLEAGYYSIAQMIGKIFLFLPSALAIVISPKSTQAYVTNSHSHKMLYKSLLLASIFCGMGIILCFLFPEFVLRILTAKSNPVSISLVGLFSLAMSFYALLWIIINYLLARHNLKFVIPLFIVALLESAFIYFFHNSLSLILWILFVFSLLSFFISLFIVKLELKNLT